MKVTLAKAFRIRNKLKERLTQIKSQWYQVEKSWPENDEPSFKRTSGKMPEGVLQEYFKVSRALRELNLSINDANSLAAQDSIIRIQFLNDEQQFLESSIDEIKRQDDFITKRNSVTGDETKIKMKSGLDSIEDWEKVLSGIKRDKFNEETRLGEINATTEVNLSSERANRDKDYKLDREIKEIIGLDF